VSHPKQEPVSQAEITNRGWSAPTHWRVKMAAFWLLEENIMAHLAGPKLWEHFCFFEFLLSTPYKQLIIHDIV